MKRMALFYCLGLVFSLFAAVEIEHKKVQKNNREYNTFRILNSAPVKNTLNYNISTYKGVKTVGDRSSASTGIGLANGWYNSGSIRIFVDGKTLNMPAKVESKKDTITFSWDSAVLKMTFPEGSEKIYCHVSAPNAKKLKLGFLAMPGFVPKRKTEMKSYVSTSKVNHFLNEGKYKTQGESWFMLFDCESNKRGIPVVILDPKDVKFGEVTGGAKSLLIVAQFEMKKSDCRFVLMGIPSNHMDAETLYEDLRANGNTYLDELRNFNFK